MIDALLGAAALGDIGQHFPDTDERFKDADSLELLRTVGDPLGERGWAIGNVDATVRARAAEARPVPRRDPRELAEALGLPQDAVNVKATTGERMGFVGRGEGRPRWPSPRSTGAPDRRNRGVGARPMRTIRLHDTKTGELTELRPRDGRKVGIYACGPTVYGRIHVGNARPFVVFSLLKRFLAHEGYEPTLVANITDINDKIYDAARPAGRPSAELAAEMTAHYVADTERLGIGRPDHEPQATLMVEEIVDLIADLIERDHAYVAEGDVYFRVRSLPEYGALSHRDVDADGPGRGRRGRRAQGGPARLRALEGAQADGGHLVGRAVGRGPPGLAHRVLGDGRGDARRAVRDPRRRQRPDLPAPRERGRADARRARARARADLDAQRHARDAAARCRSPSATSAASPRCSTRSGARRC